MTVSNVLMNSTFFKKQSRRPFINHETFTLLMSINPAIITSVISVLGIVANVTNIAIFLKLGFKETINISLVALAVTDLANLVFLLCMSLLYSPSFCGMVCDVLDLKNLEDFIAHGRAYFTGVGGCITGVIACERCFCVLRPLQVRLILTKKKLSIILSSIFLVYSLPYLPFIYTSGIGWMFNPETNRSIIRPFYRPHADVISSVCYGYVAIFNTSSYVILIIFTVLIVLKLASQHQWRTGQVSHESSKVPAALADANSKDKKKDSRISGKDRRAATTVVVIAVMYITCFFPGSVLLMVMSIVPEFNKHMLYTNLYDFLWYLANGCESICSSANIIVYLKTSTKFKKTFLGLFCRDSWNDIDHSVAR